MLTSVIPCPSALVVLLGAIAQHQVALGMLLIVAFSIGLAMTLTVDEAFAVILGRVDALSADSPVTAYVIARSEDRLEAAGPLFDAAPYGFVVAKGSPLGPVLQQAVQYLIDTGVYAEILERWNMSVGAITTSQINAATS